MPRAAAVRSVSAIKKLETDHAAVRTLLGRLEKATTADRRRKVYAEVRTAIKVHFQIEEEIFYPAFREAVRTKDDRKLFFEATEEHHVVDGVIAELDEADPASDEYAAKAKVLKDLIEHHAGEEEDEMFPRAKKLMSKEELLDLGVRLQAREEELDSE